MQSLHGERSSSDGIREIEALAHTEGKVVGRGGLAARWITLGSLTSVSTRLATLVLNLVTVPILLHALGHARYGLWMVITSFYGILNVMDAGTGTSLQNAIAAAIGRNDRERIGAYVTNSIVVVLGTSALLGGGTLFWFATHSRLPFLGADDQWAQAEGWDALIAFIFCFMLQLVASLVLRIQVAYREIPKASLWQLCAALAGTTGAVAFSFFGGTLPRLAWMTYGSQAVVLMFALFLELYALKPYLAFHPRFIDWQIVMSLLRPGLGFTALQALGSISLNIDNLVIARLGSLASVAVYSSAQRFYSAASFFVAPALLPLWTAFAEAHARGEHSWIAQTTKRVTMLLIVSLVGVTVIVCTIGPLAIAWWTGDAIHVDRLTLVGVSLTGLVVNASQGAGIFLMSTNRLRFLVATAIALLVSSVVLKGVLMEHFGIQGLAFAGGIAFFCSTTVPIAVFTRKLVGSKSLAVPPG